MNERKQPISPYVPLLVSLALVAGLFLGRSMGTGNGGPLSAFSLRQPAAADKLGQVLDLIERQYVDTVEKEALVEEVLQDMLQRLDPHSYYLSAAELKAASEPLEGSFDGIGVEFSIQRDTVVVVAPVEGGPSAQLGIRAGDRILKADTASLAGVGITNDGVTKLLRGPKGTKVKVLIGRRGRKPMEVAITRGAIPINSVAAALLRPDGTGYIKLSRFARNTHAEVVEAAERMRAAGMEHLVLDLRGNGGGYLNAAADLADEFLPEGRVIVYTEGRMSPRRDMLATGKGSFEDIPLAVLIDEGSASASEIIAGALQDNDRALILGRRSFGKGLVQEEVPLPDRSAIRLTTARYYTASGRSIQKPYGQGVDYSADYTERTQHGELYSADSARIDSSQVFRTVGGRIVYGGGGVMPDIFVPADTAEGSQFLTDLFFSGTLNDFAFELTDRERARLLAYGGSAAFKSRYVVSDDAIERLRQEAQRKGIKERPGELQRSRRQITDRLKAGVARNIWGDAGFYDVMLDSDRAFIRAIAELSSAKPTVQK